MCTSGETIKLAHAQFWVPEMAIPRSFGTIYLIFFSSLLDEIQDYVEVELCRQILLKKIFAIRSTTTNDDAKKKSNLKGCFVRAWVKLTLMRKCWIHLILRIALKAYENQDIMKKFKHEQ